MANECETSIVFYSEHKALIKDLWQNIIDFCKDNQDCTIYKFMLKRGYSQNDLYHSDKRGAITYYDSSVSYKDDIAYFKIETISAWLPQVDEFYKLVKEKYDRKISIAFKAEEMGCGIYYNTDIEGRFFKDRYKIDYCLKQDTVKYFEGFDEAISYIKKNPRIIVLRTFSKAYGKAGARLGILVSDPEIQKVFMKAKPPYNVSSPAEKAGLDALSEYDEAMERVRETIARRNELTAFLQTLPYVVRVFPSEANFVLVRVSDAAALYSYLLEMGIVVRNRSSDLLLENTLRITIGSEMEMEKLKEALNGWNG